jgi:nucleolar protein 6
MGSTPNLTKKQKKAAAFRERKTKTKSKDVLEEQAVPVMENQDMAEMEGLANETRLEENVDGSLSELVPEGSERRTSKGKAKEKIRGPKDSSLQASREEAEGSGKKRKHREDVVEVVEASLADSAKGYPEEKRITRKRRKVNKDDEKVHDEEEHLTSSKTPKQKFILFIGPLSTTFVRI